MHRFLDLRFDIGLILIVLGAILVATGITSHEQMTFVTGSLNIDVCWGTLLILIGLLFMLKHIRKSEEYGS